MAYLKSQNPIKYKEDYIYPLTTADQIILSDGTRLEKNGQIIVDSSNPDLPKPTQEDAGKFLRVDASGSSYVLETMAAAEEAEF